MFVFKTWNRLVFLCHFLLLSFCWNTIFMVLRQWKIFKSEFFYDLCNGCVCFFCVCWTKCKYCKLVFCQFMQVPATLNQKKRRKKHQTGMLLSDYYASFCHFVCKFIVFYYIFLLFYGYVHVTDSMLFHVIPLFQFNTFWREKPQL